MLIVETKEEFKKAVENKVPEFVVVGNLKSEIKKTEKLKTMSKWAITALAVGLAATPYYWRYVGVICRGQPQLLLWEQQLLPRLL